MTPLSVRAHAYRSYRDLDFEFPRGCTAIAGPNGSGKSSLIELIPLALFGGNLSRKLMRGEDALLVEMTFEHGGAVYRVRRQYKAAGRGTSTLDFEEQVADEWESRTQHDMKATQAEINRTIGLVRQTYLSSSHLAQGQGGLWTEADPRDRKEVLSQILALDRWAAALDRVRADRRAAEDEVAGLRAKAEVAQAIVDMRLEYVDAFDDATAAAKNSEWELFEAEMRLGKARDALAAQAANEERARAADEAHTAARRAVLTCEDDWAAAMRSGDQAGSTREELRRVTLLAERVPELEARIRRFQAATARDDMMSEAERKYAAAGDVLQRVGEATCERCGQTLGAEAANRAAWTYRTEADAALAEAERFGAEAGDAEEPLTWDELLAAEKEARAAAERRAALIEIVRQHETKAATLTQVADALNAAQEQETATAQRLNTAREALGDVDALRTTTKAASDAVARHRAALDDARARVIRAEAELERCQQAEQELAEIAGRMTHTSERLDVLAVLERAFGPNGIPAWLIERYAVPQIEAEANRILADFNTPYRVELRTQREKKDGGLREALDIVVTDGMHEGDYSEFSGGEKTRLNLALRIALAGLLANRRGAESRVLCIDEPDGLDAAGMEQLAGILGDLVTRGVFATVLIVSHNPLLASSFEQTLEIVKDGDRSRIVGVTEAVTA